MKTSIIIALSALVLFSCKKNNDETCTISTASIAGTYKLTASKYKQTPASAEMDIFATLSACEKDDLNILVAGGVFNYQDVGTVCSPNGSYSSTWSLSGSNLTIDGDLYVIQSFNCSTLIVTQSNVVVAGDKITATFVKQ